MDKDTYREIAEIRDELARQGGLIRTMVYANRNLIEEILEAFEDDLVMARIFLELQSPGTQKEIVERLKDVSGASQPSVSRKMERLEKELGLISPLSSAGGATRYGHSDSAAALRLIPTMKKNSALKGLF